MSSGGMQNSGAMSMVEQSNFSIQGNLEIAPLAIARLASHAVLRSYGVVGMAAPNLASDLAWTLTRDPHRGIEVRIENDHIFIDLYIIIEYGTRVAVVANSLINAVRFYVEKATAMSVSQIIVHVQGVRVSE
jgi:uncharacterized alkaline shock family protein YloU